MEWNNNLESSEEKGESGEQAEKLQKGFQINLIIRVKKQKQ